MILLRERLNWSEHTSRLPNFTPLHVSSFESNNKLYEFTVFYALINDYLKPLYNQLICCSIYVIFVDVPVIVCHFGDSKKLWQAKNKMGCLPKLPEHVSVRYFFIGWLFIIEWETSLDGSSKTRDYTCNPSRVYREIYRSENPWLVKMI